jgi:hypothetical protein
MRKKKEMKIIAAAYKACAVQKFHNNDKALAEPVITRFTQLQIRKSEAL